MAQVAIDFVDRFKDNFKFQLTILYFIKIVIFFHLEWELSTGIEIVDGERVTDFTGTEVGLLFGCTARWNLELVLIAKMWYNRVMKDIEYKPTNYPSDLTDVQ
jgi:hypothetical protein